ncbi:MAG TPA: neutral zinc metallopeptidase [Baekduia sp.]|nr:neutral zinc metallopeptidase [Baekduia sp.]
MRRRWLLILVTALLVAGCGSSSGGDATTTQTATATTSTTVESTDLERLPQVPEPAAPPPSTAAAGSRDAFLRAVFDDVQAMWKADFREAGLTYRPERLTIFQSAVDTACGTQPAAVGPFYCPADAGVYLDTRFFAALSAHVGVEIGDFAQAYVIAHEVGHHVQVLTGVSQAVAAADQQDPAGVNARSVRVELQADCLAGVWAHTAYRRGDLSEDDFRDALRAAAVIGDDFAQRRTTGTIKPEDWTHGSSAQRQHWLTTGFQEGQPAACDTFT